MQKVVCRQKYNPAHLCPSLKPCAKYHICIILCLVLTEQLRYPNPPTHKGLYRSHGNCCSITLYFLYIQSLIHLAGPLLTCIPMFLFWRATPGNSIPAVFLPLLGNYGKQTDCSTKLRHSWSLIQPMILVLLEC